MTKTQLNIATMLRKAGRKVTTIDATDERNVKVVTDGGKQLKFCRNCQGPIDEHTTSCEACGATDFET